MARKTPQELQEARRQKAERRRQEEEAATARTWEKERQEIERMTRENELHEKHSQLDSYVNGTYEEISKLSIKWPTQPVTKLTLDKANRAIRSARELLVNEKDEYYDEINELVPAGDNPEARDVVMVLRQVKDALNRMEKRHGRVWRGY